MKTTNATSDDLSPNPQGCQRFTAALESQVSPQALFAWHERPGAFQRLCPPWDPVTVLHKADHIRDGALAELKIRLPLGVPATLKVTHEGYRAGERFMDRQLKGPFAYWRHSHEVSASDEGGALLSGLR